MKKRKKISSCESLHRFTQTQDDSKRSCLSVISTHKRSKPSVHDRDSPTSMKPEGSEIIFTFTYLSTNSFLPSPMANHTSTIKQSSLTLVFLLLLPPSSTTTQAQADQASGGQKAKSPVSAIFAFGDSTVDPGNNNFIPTAFRSDFPPYGRDFFTHMPTGRFTNGKLVTDFVASYLGLKEELPAYLDWSLGSEELMTGVSFASAGSGFDPLTAQIGAVIAMPQQLSYFRDYLNKLDLMIGKKRREDIINKAVFVVSAATNDFISYATLPFRRKSFSIEGYEGFIIQNVKDFLEGRIKLLLLGCLQWVAYQLLLPSTQGIKSMSEVALRPTTLYQRTTTGSSKWCYKNTLIQGEFKSSMRISMNLYLP